MTPVDDLLSKLGPRRQSFALVVEYLHRIVNNESPFPVLVETGCIRSLDDYGAGYSTYLWNLLAQQIKIKVASIDIDPVNIQFAQGICKHIEFVRGDSVAVLNRAEHHTIDVLYLDSFDLDRDDPHPSSLHHLCELTAAAKALKPGALVMVDDNYDDCGKGEYVEAFMTATRRRKVFDGVQKIWTW